jgi:tRNA (guanine37-N1)-methyltransferase
MKFYFLTIFPELFVPVLSSSVIGRAQKSGVYSYEAVDIRSFSDDKHRHVDDHPYGGGPGMVMRADVLEKALLYCFDQEQISLQSYDRTQYCTIVTSASGNSFTQHKASELSRYTALFIVCGHYEGIDQRFIDKYSDIELRIGDYVVTGGELPALVISDAIIRLLPQALGSEESVLEESFSLRDEHGLLPEYPHYTRPAVFNEIAVPEVLTSGNHADIKEWRLAKSQELRLKREPQS